MSINRELFNGLNQMEEPLAEIRSLLEVLFHSLSHTPDEIEYDQIQRVLLIAKCSLTKIEAGYDQISDLQAGLRDLAKSEQRINQVPPVMQVANTSESIM